MRYKKKNNVRKKVRQTKCEGDTACQRDREIDRLQDEKTSRQIDR